MRLRPPGGNPGTELPAVKENFFRVLMIAFEKIEIAPKGMNVIAYRI